MKLKFCYLLENVFDFVHCNYLTNRKLKNVVALSLSGDICV